MPAARDKIGSFSFHMSKIGLISRSVFDTMTLMDSLGILPLSFKLSFWSLIMITTNSVNQKMANKHKVLISLLHQ